MKITFGSSPFFFLLRTYSSGEGKDKMELHNIFIYRTKGVSLCDILDNCWQWIKCYEGYCYTGAQTALFFNVAVYTSFIELKEIIYRGSFFFYQIYNRILLYITVSIIYSLLFCLFSFFIDNVTVVQDLHI